VEIIRRCRGTNIGKGKGIDACIRGEKEMHQGGGNGAKKNMHMQKTV
jgi:hypothetical protein